jgi:hypothetical protein
MLSPRAFFRRWPIASIMLCVHTVLLLLFTAGYATSHDPNRGFLWQLPYGADMPSSLLATRVAGLTADATTLCIAFGIAGGIQWAGIGVALDLMRRRFSKTSSARPTRDI